MQFVLWICFLFGNISKNSSWDWYFVVQTHKYFWTGGHRSRWSCPLLHPSPAQLFSHPAGRSIRIITVDCCVCAYSIWADIHDNAESHHLQKPYSVSLCIHQENTDLVFFIVRLFRRCLRVVDGNGEHGGGNSRTHWEYFPQLCFFSAQSHKHWAECSLLVGL